MNVETNHGRAAAVVAERVYDLCHPVIRRARQRVLEEIHRTAAARWSEVLSDTLPEGRAVIFEGIGIDTFKRFTELAPEDARVTNFELEPTGAGAFLAIDGALLRALVDARIGVVSVSDSHDGQLRPFTRLESVIVRELQAALMESLGEIYRARRFGAPASTHHGERLSDNLLLSPDDRIVLFRFGFGPGAPGHVITVGAKVESVDTIEEPSPDRRARASATVTKHAAALPVGIDLVLGSWDVALADLAALKPGDLIVLPEGEDAWLASGTVELRRVRVTLSGRRMVIAPMEGSGDPVQG